MLSSGGVRMHVPYIDKNKKNIILKYTETRRQNWGEDLFDSTSIRKIK